jgi:protein SCO1/2
MNRNIKITVIACLAFVVLVLVMTYYRTTATPSEALSAEQLREVGALVYDKPVNLNPFALQDHRGASFSNSSLNGQWTLVFFGFTSCPDICPLTLTELRQFYTKLEEGPLAADTQIVMVSVDPVRDTTEALANYMGSFHESFLGVNGDYDDIAAFARQLFIAHSPPPSLSNEHAEHDMASMDIYDIDHGAKVLIINPQGEYVGFFDAAIQDAALTRGYAAIRAAN